MTAGIIPAQMGSLISDPDALGIWGSSAGCKDTSGRRQGLRSGKRMRHGKQDFPGLLDQSFLGETAESGQDGRNYTEYLSCMMFLMDRGVRNFRMMDLIQWNILDGTV